MLIHPVLPIRLHLASSELHYLPFELAGQYPIQNPVPDIPDELPIPLLRSERPYILPANIETENLLQQDRPLYHR